MSTLSAHSLASHRLVRSRARMPLAQTALPAIERIQVPFARIALFIVYFWFGALKLAGVSPAGPLVTALWQKTIPFIPLNLFMALFATYEVLIGILFLMPRFQRLALGLLLLHVSMTVMPLVLLPGIVWQNFLVPSLEGQYIIKNVVIVALALSIGTTRPAALDPVWAQARRDHGRA